MRLGARGLAAMLFIGAAVCLPGCGGRSATTASDLVIGVIGEPTSLNPLLLSGSPSMTIGPLVYSGLLTVDAKGNIVPDLATRVPSPSNGGVSTDGLTITYHLRKNVRWQDGAPLTSADVAYTYRQIMNPKVNVPSRTGYDRVVRVLTPDPLTVVLKLKSPDASILSYFFAPDGDYFVLPRHVLAAVPDLNKAAFNLAPIGSGPYRVTTWAHGDYLRFERNDAYFGGRPAIAQLVLKNVPSAQTQLNQMRTRELTAVFVPNVELAHSYASIPGVTVSETPISGAVLLTFNMSDPSTKSTLVREAIAHALDVPRIVKLATRGLRTPANAGRGVFGRGFDPSIPALPDYNPVLAQHLLAQSGWKPQPLDLAYDNASPESSTVALLVQQQLRRIGVTVNIHAYTAQQYSAPAAEGGPLFGGKFALAILELLSPNDPDTSWFLGCDQFPPKGFNLARFCDPAIDAANVRGLQSYDPKVRSRYAAIVQRRVATDLPFVPLWQQSGIMALPNTLRGVNPSPLSAFWNVGAWRLR